MPESTQRGFLSSHPSPVERFLAMERVVEALKKGQDPLKEFAPKKEEEKGKEQKETPAPADPKP